MILKVMQRSPLIGLLSRSALPAGCLLVIAYFASHALFGTSGILVLGDIRRAHSEQLERRADLEARKAEMERNIALLDPRGADPDLADELVRRHLGVVRPDEVIVPLEKPAGRD